MRYTFFVDATKQREKYKAVLRQGDLDGACGIYSFLMCLHLCGFIDSMTSFYRVDKRTALGKLVKQFREFENMFPAGIVLDDLEAMIRNSYGAHLHTQACRERGHKVLDFTIEHLLAGHPVMVGVTGRGFSHWLVAAGLEFVADSPDMAFSGMVQPERIFVLDPSSDYARFSLWNGFILTEPAHKGIYPYVLHNGFSFGFDDALAVWRKTDM